MALPPTRGDDDVAARSLVRFRAGRAQNRDDDGAASSTECPLGPAGHQGDEDSHWWWGGGPTINELGEVAFQGNLPHSVQRLRGPKRITAAPAKQIPAPITSH
jgi:hypothetical protein